LQAEARLTHLQEQADQTQASLTLAQTALSETERSLVMVKAERDR
jgi:hypothetical protein